MADVQENDENDARRRVTHLQLPGAFDPSSRASFGGVMNRRKWLLGACAAAAALAFTSVARFNPRFNPLGITPAFADAPAGGGLDAFLALSQHLTARTSFNAVLGQRVYAALVQSDNQFTQNVAALNTWLAGHGGVPSDTVTQALAAEQPPLAKAVTAIMQAWYLGLVGEMPHVQVVAYESALMFDPVKDVLTIPSYCRDVPFYWTQKPAGA
ncbi:MAG: sugar dehydrogenase complex small subunit [Paraburkholderia sp.]|uniref:sugar dehydrogenase complex small subunit n=1 Tax=Paraburkholderia sp. TaxID=1926495 RepID=UPI003C3C9184